MCNPVAVAGAQFGGQALSSIGEFGQQRAQTDAVNKGRANQYRNQLAMRELKYNTDVNAYSARMSDYRAGNLERAELLALLIKQHKVNLMRPTEVQLLQHRVLPID